MPTVHCISWNIECTHLPACRCPFEALPLPLSPSVPLSRCIKFPQSPIFAAPFLFAFLPSFPPSIRLSLPLSHLSGGGGEATIICGRVTKREKTDKWANSERERQEVGLGMGRSLEAERVSEMTRGYAEREGEGARVWQSIAPGFATTMGISRREAHRVSKKE